MLRLLPASKYASRTPQGVASTPPHARAAASLARTHTHTQAIHRANERLQVLWHAGFQERLLQIPRIDWILEFLASVNAETGCPNYKHA